MGCSNMQIITSIAGFLSRPQVGPGNEALQRLPGTAGIPRALVGTIEIERFSPECGGLGVDTDGKVYVGLNRGDIQVYESGQMKGVLRGHVDSVHKFAFSSKGPLYSVAWGSGTIRAWQNWNGECLAVLEGPKKGVSAMACAPNGDLYSSYYSPHCTDPFFSLYRSSLEPKGPEIWVWRQNQCVDKLEGLKVEEPTGSGAFVDLGNTSQIVFAKDGTMYTLSRLNGRRDQIDYIVVWRDNRPLYVLPGEPPKLGAQLVRESRQLAIGLNNDLYTITRRSRREDGVKRGEVAFWRNEQYYGIRNIDGGDSPGNAGEYDHMFLTVGPNGVAYVLQKSELHGERARFQVLMWKDDEFLGHLDVSKPSAAGGIDLKYGSATRIAVGPDGTLYVLHNAWKRPSGHFISIMSVWK